MPVWIILKGVKPYDGRYEMPDDFTTQEYGWIKRFSGYHPLTAAKGWEVGDPELYMAFAAIGIYRTGRVEAAEMERLYERLAAVPFTKTFDLEADQEPEDEGDADPPASSPGNTSSSGEGSTPSSASTGHPNGSGTPGSATSESAPVMSAT